MSESLQAIFEHVIWSVCYLSVLLGLSAFGIHRYLIIYLFLKNRQRRIEPAARFRALPTVTVQLPVYNEYYVIRRLIRAVSQLDYPRDKLQIQVLDDSTDETQEIAASEVARLKAKGYNIDYIIAITERVSRREHSPPVWRMPPVSSSLFLTLISCLRLTRCGAPLITSPTRASAWCRCGGAI